MTDRWEGDDAHQAVDRWILSWRDKHRTEPRPSLTFAAHLGREAATMAAELPRVELLRLFSASGFDGSCVCGKAPREAAAAERAA